MGSISNNYHWKVFWTVAIALFAMVMDFSIVFLALSSIADEFNVTLRTVTWVAISTSLTISAIMLPLGRVSDITGRKKFHIFGMLFFVAGALLAFSSQTLEMLIVSRVVMSIGSAMGQAVVFAIIVGVFPSNERGKALGVITLAIGTAPLGALALGVMAEEMSAPFALRINAILSIVCLVLVGLLAPALRRPIVTG